MSLLHTANLQCERVGRAFAPNLGQLRPFNEWFQTLFVELSQMGPRFLPAGEAVASKTWR